MAKWKKTLDISDLHQAYGDGSITIIQVAKEVHSRCLKLKINDIQFMNITSNFLLIEDIDDYDSVLSDLYDFGDEDHKLWINTMHFDVSGCG